MKSLLSRVMGGEKPPPTDGMPSLPSRRSVIGVVPVSSVDDRARTALSTALSMSANRVVAVHVCDTLESGRAFTRAWERWEPGVPLVLLDRVGTGGDPVVVSVADYLSRRHTAYQTLVVVAGDHGPSRTDGQQVRPTRGDALEAALLTLPHVVVCRQRPVAS
ncbi:MAG: hypothetical protein ABWX74_10805 [Aeromicrobium sp.]